MVDRLANFRLSDYGYRDLQCLRLCSMLVFFVRSSSRLLRIVRFFCSESIWL